MSPQNDVEKPQQETAPATKPKHALLISLGKSPAILTEAIWWHAKVANPPILFDKIVALTTTRGRVIAERTLLDPNRGFYPRLQAALGPDAVPEFTTTDIVALQTAAGRDLDDVIQYDNAVVQMIFDQIQALHADGCVVHACYAGGRKIMGPLFATAFQLAAHPGDELFHVLVDSELEDALPANWAFPEGPRKGRNGLDIPEVEQINCLHTQVLYWPGSRTERERGSDVGKLIEDRQFELNGMYHPYPMTITAAGEIQIGGRTINLTSLQLCIYRVFASIASGKVASPDGPGISLNGWREYFLNAPERRDYAAVNGSFERWHQHVHPQGDGHESRLKGWLSDRGATPAIATQFSNINNEFARVLGQSLSRYYQILSDEQYARLEGAAPPKGKKKHEAAKYHRIWLPAPLIKVECVP